MATKDGFCDGPAQPLEPAWRWRDTLTLLLGAVLGQIVQLAILMWRTWP